MSGWYEDGSEQECQLRKAERERQSKNKKPSPAVPEALAEPAIPKRHENEYWRGTTPTYTRQLIEELGRAEATIAELVEALKLCIRDLDIVEQEIGENSDGATMARKLLARAKEASHGTKH